MGGGEQVKFYPYKKGCVENGEKEAQNILRYFLTSAVQSHTEGKNTIVLLM